MKVHVSLYDENDRIVAEGEVALTPVMAAKSAPKAASAGPSGWGRKGSLDFSLPERAFFKRYAASLSGPKQFVLLLAYLAHGKAGQPVALSDVKGRWGKMISILGNDFTLCIRTAQRSAAGLTLRRRDSIFCTRLGVRSWTEMESLLSQRLSESTLRLRSTTMRNGYALPTRGVGAHDS